MQALAVGLEDWMFRLSMPKVIPKEQKAFAPRRAQQLIATKQKLRLPACAVCDDVNIAVLKAGLPHPLTPCTGSQACYPLDIRQGVTEDGSVHVL